MKDSIKTITTPYKLALENEFEKLFNEIEQGNILSQELLQSVKYSVLDAGKRIRPILSLITAEAIINNTSSPQKAVEVKDNPALGLALAIELVHCGSLIHDDLPCMDDDDLRRGKASNHKEFGEATALLAGDFLMTFPLEVFIKKTQGLFKDNKTLLTSTQKLIEAINKMINGQSLDMEFSSNGNKISVEQVQIMQSQKTGALLEASIEIAAILAGATDQQVKNLRNYAKNLGLAFQITDDILDCVSNSEELGKTTGKDLEQNKFTYVKHYGLEKSKEIAENLIKEANAQIETIGISPAKLSLIAQYVILRTN